MVSVITSVRDGYLFLSENSKEIFKLGLIPICVCFINLAIVNIFFDETSQFKHFLLTLPSAFALAVYGFLQTEWQVFGKNAPERSEYSFARRQRLIGSVSCYLLYQMLLSVFAYSSIKISELGMEYENTTSPSFSTEGAISFITLAIVFVWSFKIGFLSLILAAGADLKDFWQEAKGFAMSYVVLGITLLSHIPILIFFLFVGSIIFSGSVEDVNLFQKIASTVLSALLAWLSVAVLHASGVSALQQFYKKVPKGS